MKRSIRTRSDSPIAASAWLIAVLLLTSVAPVLAQDPQPMRGGRVLVKDRIVVKPRPESGQGALRSRLSALGAQVKVKPATAVSTEGSLDALGLMVVKVDPAKHIETLNDLAARPDVRMAAPVYKYEPALTPNDPSYPSQYHHALMGSPGAWDKTTGVHAVIIAILDTGVSSHADLPNLMAGWNFADGNSNTADIQGHGTAVAGCAASMGNNGLGIAGFAWGSRILPIRIADANGSAYSDTIAAAMKWAADQGAKVINCSYGPLQGDSVIENAAAYARARGALVFVSAGNDGNRDPSSPSSNIIFVSATNASDQLVSWSTYGPAVKLAAPGERILTTTRAGGYSYFSGTSFSSPIAAGAAALIFGLDSTLTPGAVEDILRSTAKDLGAAGFDERYGSGRIDVRAAALSSAPAIATMTAPAPGATISGSRARFQWTKGFRVVAYWLAVGKTQGGTEYFGANTGTNLLQDVPGLATDGSTIHVRIWSQIGTSWTGNFQDVSYTSSPATSPLAAITSPTPGSTLEGSSTTLTWSAGTGVSQYWLAIGTTQGGIELFGANVGSATSIRLGGFPVDGRTIYVRLWSQIDGSWTDNFTDTTFKAANAASSAKIAEMVSPIPNSAMPGPAVTLSWSSGSSVTRYWLAVGSTRGGTEYFGADVGTVRSQTVSNLPTNGSTVFVRIWSLINATWTGNYQDVTYAAATAAGIATMASPAPGAILAGRTVTFTWTKGTGVSAYWLAVGKTPGGIEYFGANTGTATSITVSNLPADGSTVQVRIWSQLGSTWTNNYQDATYKASTASSQPAIAQMQSPAPGSTLPGSSATLQWSPGSDAVAYWLCLGSTPGGTEYFGANVGLNVSQTIHNLPSNGGTVHVRIWTQIGSVWTGNYQDVSYLAASQ